MNQKTSSRSIARRGTRVSSTLNENNKGNGNLPYYLQAAINSLEDELMVIGRDFRIIEVNKAVLSRHGSRREELIGKHCYTVSHGFPEPCGLPLHECPIEAVLATGKPAQTTHVHVYHLKGAKRERYLDIVASPITDEGGDVIAIACVMRDITEAKELESKIAKAHQDLLALNTIASVATQSLELDTVLNSALDKTLETMHWSTGGIMLLDEEGQTLSYRVHRGLSKRYIREMRLGLGEGIAGRVAKTGKAILVEDFSTDTRAYHRDLIASEGLRAFACVPLPSKERVLGVINIASHQTRKFSAEDMQFLGSIAVQIAIAIENAKLHQEVQHKEEIRGELLQDIFSIQEEERRRIARELHDETSQVLASLAASLEAASSMLSPESDKIRHRLKEAQAMSVNLLDEIHKIIYELRPSLLDDLGLVAAIRWLVDNNLGTVGISVSFTTTGKERRLDPKLETTLFRVVQEAVNNIAKHAKAKKAEISLLFKKNTVRVRVKDDGRGFKTKEAMSSKDRPRGLGLLGMKERVELRNGTLGIQSRPGGGTEINIEIPLNKEAGHG